MPKQAIQDIFNNHGKEVADLAAASTALGAYLSWLPEIAALLAIVWTGIRIGEWVYEKFNKIFRKESKPDG